MRIYVASSWRNPYQPAVIKCLRDQGHEVYDFRNPRPGNQGFAWAEIDPGWLAWNPGTFRRALLAPIAMDGFTTDSSAVYSCDCCVLVLPSGRSAHLEAGVAVGLGKKLFIYMPESCEPELMYSWAEKICITRDELIFALRDAKVGMK